MAFLGLLYISLSWALMIDLSGFNGPFLKISGGRAALLPCIVILCMWVNDTMAYIVGSLIGKTPLSKISPKKTWEGTVGGIILCIGAMGWIGSTLGAAGNSESSHSNIASYHWYIIAGIAAVMGTLGDLLESKLKRMAGVKDSGTLMPGHGGFLDRFDSLLLAVPFVWLYVQLI